MLKNEVYKRDLLYRIAALGFFAAFVIYFLHLLFDKRFTHDEFELVHTVWKICRGEKIYVDFFQHHHPLYYYCLIPVMKLLGEQTYTILAIRIITFFITLLTAAVGYLLTVHIFDKKTAVIALFLLFGNYAFVPIGIEIRPDVAQTFFGLTALLLLFYYYDKGKLSFLILSSVCLSISFMFLQKAVFAGFLIGCVLLFSLIRKEVSFKHFTLYWLSVVLVTGIFLLFYLLSGTFSEYLMFNWRLNANLIETCSPYKGLAAIFIKSPMLWLISPIGFVLFLKTSNQKRLGFISLGFLALTFAAGAPNRQYFFLLLPLLAAIGAAAVNSAFDNKKLRRILILLYIGGLLTIPPIQKYFDPGSSSEQLQKIKYVLSITDESDYVYDGDIKFNLYRKDLDFFWYSLDPGKGLMTYQKMTDYKYDILTLIDKYRPKVISTHLIEDINDKRIKDNYSRSKQYDDLFVRLN